MNQPRTHVYTWAALVLLAFLFATNVYRAATQSVTIDEAFTYLKHIAGPQYWMFAIYTANNHVLNTLLAKLTTSVFGLSELSLRLPSLAGGLLYFTGLWRLGRVVFGPSPWFLLFVAANSLNPFILDFLSAARGYGMGLGFLMWGLGYLMEGRAVRTGLTVGLAVASQLTYAVPASAITVASLVWHSARSAWRLAGTAALTAAAILAWPMRHARLEDFYVGEASLSHTIRSLSEVALFYRPTALQRFHIAFEYISLLLLAGCAAALLLALYTRADKLLAACGVLFGSVALLGVARLFVARPFPAGRTALYFYPLVSLAVILLLAQSKIRAVRTAGALAACVCVLQFVLEFNLSYYWVYRADAGAKRIFRAIEAHHTQVPGEAKVGASWELADSLNFYRVMRGAPWMRPVTREGADCYFDYYVLMDDDSRLMNRYELEELHRDPIARVRLAHPGKAALQRLAAVFPPPVQTAPPCRVDPQRLAPFVRMNEPAAEAHLVQDVGGPGGDARWTYSRPILLFRPGARFSMRIRLIGELFPPGAGPLEIAVLVNGRHLGANSYNAPGDHSFEAPVPPEYTQAYPVAAVELRSSRHFTPPGDDAVLGFELIEAGFTSSVRR